ncbi:hypothetical protein ACTG2C_22415 [Aeromonas veronii]|uniref:hypothetical protein n=1 Tax=Aeromonas veronii TaxID=654 RepID=UPI00227B22BE|nr:hypothetical protein [Aeromonas veronii]
MSLWMSQGKIKLTQNSKDIVGVGTSFLSAAVPARPGQPLVVNGMILEIAAVNSDTSITLADSYSGATAENLPYFVMTTMEGSYNDLARRAAQVMGYYQGYMDVYHKLFTGSGIVSVELPDGSACDLPAWGDLQPKDKTLTAISEIDTAKDKILYFTGVDACETTTLTQFARSLLDDANAQSALATLTAYGKSNILGAVSQSSGVPTGAIIERGKNANGSFIKFADGTLLCWKEITSSAGSAPSWTFPVAFLVTPSVIVTPVNGNPAHPTVFNLGVSACQIAVWNLSQQLIGSNVSAVAIGVWF